MPPRGAPVSQERGPWCDALKQGFVDALAADAAGVSLEPPATPDAPPAPPAPQDERAFAGNSNLRSAMRGAAETA
eukprot:966687-Prymnesium_polylepis.2